MQRSILTTCTIGVLGLSILVPATASHASTPTTNGTPPALSADARSAEAVPLDLATARYVPGGVLLIEGTTAPNARVLAVLPDESALSASADERGRFTVRRAMPTSSATPLRVELTAATDHGRTDTVRTIRPQRRSLTVASSTYVPGDALAVSGSTDPYGFVRVDVPELEESITATADRNGVWSVRGDHSTSGDEDGPIAVAVTAPAAPGYDASAEPTLRAAERRLTVTSTDAVVGAESS